MIVSINVHSKMILREQEILEKKKMKKSRDGFVHLILVDKIQ